MMPSDRAWITLGFGVLAWDVTCKDGDTLSEAADRYLLRHPWLVRCVAFAVAAHLSNAVPDRYDVVHRLFLLFRRCRR
jgi:hypothetical protein